MMNSNHDRPLVAVYGGTFNPIHNGHIALAKHLLISGKVQQVFFMPSYQPPHKSEKEIASYEDRCKMIELSVCDIPNMEVCKLESELEGPSYTLRTLDELSHRWLDREFAWVIGADELNQLHTWDPDPIRLVRNYDFICYLRDGVSVDLTQLRKYWPGWLCRKLLNGIVFDAPMMDISSTRVREIIATDGVAICESYLPWRVMNYIFDNKLYGDKSVEVFEGADSFLAPNPERC